MKTNPAILRRIIAPFIAVAFFISCQEKLEDPRLVESKVKEAIYQGMLDWYYWNDELRRTIDVNKYISNEQLLEDLKYHQLDKWSYLTTKEDFNRAFTGQNAGLGVGISLDAEDRLWLSFVYAESPAGKDGWQRGWEIVGVNGKPVSAYKRGSGYDLQLGSDNVGVTNTFTLRILDGSIVEKTVAKAEYQSNSVLYQNVLTRNGKKVGYWVYNSFKATPNITPTKSLEVEESMAYFEGNQIDELIIDLRYNGGGSVDVAEQLLNYLIPSSASGKLMYTNILNEGKSKFNEEQKFEKTGNLQLDRVVFITSRGSASASELIINCLTPYFGEDNVVLIGDNTYGKPVGAFPLSQFYKPLEENNVELVPITFAIANANGQAGYYEGFPVDYPVMDDPAKNWGDEDEGRFNAALEYIETGAVDMSARIAYKQPRWAMIDNFEGLKKEFPVY